VPRHAEAQPFAVAARRTITIGRNGRRHVLKETKSTASANPARLLTGKTGRSGQACCQQEIGINGHDSRARSF
jgi:hypothetical protein